MTVPITENRDPDGLGCYSDHAHDILNVGECMLCGSTEPEVVGHVLPQVKRLKGIDPVKASAIVAHERSMKFVDGVLLDYQTAGAIQAVYNGLSTDEAKAKLRAMDITTAGVVCWKVINRVSERTG